MRVVLSVHSFLVVVFLCVQAMAQVAPESKFITVSTGYQEVACVFNEADKNSLYVFDIDNTLIETDEPAFRSAPQYKETLRKAVAELQKKYPETATPEGYDLLWSIASRDCARHLTESDIPARIKVLESKGARAVALSYFDPGKRGVLNRVEVWRFQELQSVGVTFKNSFPELPNDHTFTNLPPKNGRYPVYYEGVLGCDHLSKGEVLGAFLDWAHSVFGYKPERVVVIDDLEVHVRSMLAALKQRGIAAVGIYYAIGSSVTTPVDLQKLEAKLDYLAKNKQWCENL